MAISFGLKFLVELVLSEILRSLRSLRMTGSEGLGMTFQTGILENT
ncbi:MAG: hypothetical protein HZC11_08475 [Nitrospirae bacterium]|nr:hypothetical protein [Nitrospirota bacterium]